MKYLKGFSLFRLLGRNSTSSSNTHATNKRKLFSGSLMSLLILVLVVGGGSQNVWAAWDSNSATAMNTSSAVSTNRVKTSAQFATTAITVNNVAAGSDRLSTVTLTLTGGGAFNPATDLAALSADSASGIAIYKDNTNGGFGTFGVEDQAMTLAAPPVLTGSSPSWTTSLDLVASGLNLISADTTAHFLIVVKIDSSVTNDATFQLQTNTLIYDTAGVKTVDVTAPASGSYTIDSSVPTIPVSNRETQDLDADGMIDAIKVTMSENILDSTLVGGDFAVAGYTVASISGTANSSTANDSVFYLTLTEGDASNCGLSATSGCDTHATPNVTYAAGSLTDHAGNALASTGAIASTDKAAPVPMYSLYSDGNNGDGDGQVDGVLIAFSEPILSDGYNAADYTPSTPGTITLAEDTGVTELGGDDLGVSMLGAAGITGGAENPVVAYTNNFAEGSRGLNDAAGNAVASFSKTAYDNAKPIIKNVTIEDTDVDGKIDKLTYTWTENIRTVGGVGVAPVAGDLPATVLPDGTTTNFATNNPTISNPAGTSADVVVTFTTDQAGANTAAGSTAISNLSDLSALWRDASNGANAPHATAAVSHETVVDSAVPAIVSSTGSDSDNDGKTNSYTLTFSEALTDKGAAAVNANFTARNSITTSAITVSTVAVGNAADAGAVTNVKLNLDDADTDNFTGIIQFSYDSGLGGAVVEDASTATGDYANQTNVSFTDDVKPVLLYARAINAGGTADVLDNAGDYFQFTFSETMRCTVSDANCTAPTIADLEGGLAFANGATDGNNLGDGATPNTISRETRFITGDTYKIIGDASTSANLVTPATDTAQVTLGTNIKDLSNTTANTNPIAITITLADVTPPTFTSIATKDLDANGKIDAIYVDMNENVSDTTIARTDFTLAASYTTRDFTETFGGIAFVGGVGTDVADDDKFYIAVTETSATCTASDASGCDTSAIPAVTYTGGTLADASGNLTATSAGQVPTDGAAPVAMYAKYKDTAVADGRVDRIDITFSETITKATYNDADYTIVAGGVGLANETATAASGTDLQVSSLGTAYVTGTAGAASTITYTNNNNDITDGTNNIVTFGPMTIGDAAAPFYFSSQTLDNNNDGTVDYVKVVYSEPILDSSVAAIDFETGIANTTAGNLTESFTAGTPSTGNATDSLDDSTIYIGISSPSTLETIVANTTDYTLKVEQVGSVSDASSAANALATFSLQTSTDGAKPIIVSSTFYDAAASDGKLDRITTVWSESISAAADGSGDWALTGDNFSNIVEGTVECNAGGAAATECDYNFTTDTVKTDVGNLSLVYTAGVSVTDGTNTANTVTITSASTPVAFTDGAAPIATGATYADNGNNGSVDELVLTFSESVTKNASELGQLAVTENDLTSYAGTPSAVSGSTTSALTFTMAATTDLTGVSGGTEPTLTYTQSAGTPANRIKDSSDNYLSSPVITPLTDDAAPVIVSSTFYDLTGPDGLLDRITTVWSENISTVADGASKWALTSAENFADVTEGTVMCNSGAAAANACNYNFTTTTIKTSVGDLSLAYDSTGGSVTDGVNAASSKTISSASTPAFTDGAKPIIKNVTIEDTGTPNGMIDKITYTWTENVDIKSTNHGGTTPVAADLPTTLLPDGTTADFTGASITDPAGTGATVEVTVVAGQVTANTAAAATAISGDLSTLWVDASSAANTPHASAATGNETVVDSAAPVVTALNISDADANGKLDTATLTYSENLTNTAAAANGFDVTSVSTHGSCTTESVDPAASSTLTLTYSCATIDTTVGDLNIVFTANSAVQDSSSNQSLTKTFTTASTPAITDSANPVPVSATSSKAVSSGNLQTTDIITVTFSETVTPTSVANANWKFSRNGAESLSAANWPDGSTIAYSSAAATTVTATLTGATTSGAWGPYAAKVNMSGNGIATIVDANSNTANMLATDIVIAGISGPAINSTPVVAVADTTATLAWTTASATTTNRVKYGTTVALSETPSTAGSPGESTTTHSISLSGLTASTLYYYQVCFTNVSETCTTIDHFTTTAAEPSVNSVTRIDAVQTFATADNNFANGWKWVFNITVPTTETKLQMKFGSFINGSSSITPISNVRYYSSQASDYSTSGNPVTIDAISTYPATLMTLNSDLDSNTPGRQVQVSVDMKVPATDGSGNAPAGAYTTSYGVNTDTP